MTDNRPDTAVSSGELVERLSRTIDDVLAPLVPRGARVALLDFPNHNNVGDNAIWLGEIAFLRRRGVEIAYVCDISSYCGRTLRQRIGDGTILLHGGGSFGTIWPRHQAFRERVVAEFATHRIVQLPQTVDFTDDGSSRRAAQILGKHPELTILARDWESLSTLTDDLGLPAILCPDMAFCLGTFERRPPSKDVLWLARSDREAVAEPPPDAGSEIEVVDWLHGEPGRPWSYALARLTVRTRRAVAAAMERSLRLRRLAGPALGATFDVLAERRFERGRRILSRGRVVVTDRLHGHILSLLLGIPHVLLDNKFGKLARFQGAFTKDCHLAHSASNPEHALQIVRQILLEEDRRPGPRSYA